MGISSKNDNTFLTNASQGHPAGGYPANMGFHEDNFFRNARKRYLHFLFQFGSSNKLVRQIDKGDCETLPPALKIVQQLQFVLPVDFAYLPFHPIALYSPFETPLRNADQYRGGCFPCSMGIYTTRIGKMENDLELPPSNIFRSIFLLFSLSALHKVYTLTLFIYCFP